MRQAGSALLWLLSAGLGAALGQSIQGNVTDALTHVGIPSASINAQGPGHKAFSTTADDKGHFQFHDLPPGTYVLEIHSKGYVPLPREDPARQPLTISGTSATISRDAALRPAARVSGRVLATDVNPVAGSVVQLFTLSGAPGDKQTADREGAFEFDSVAPGDYLLIATAPTRLSVASGEPEQAWSPTYYPGVTGRSAAVPLRLHAGMSAVGQDILLRTVPVHHLRGVLLASGQPLPPGVAVKATEANPTTLTQPPELSVASGEGGRFDLAGLADGQWRLTAEAKAEGGIIWRGFSEATVIGHDLERVEINLRPPFSWSGTAVLEGAGPTSASDTSHAVLRPKVSVVLLPKTGGADAFTLAVADGAGRFTFPQIYKDSYRITSVPIKSSLYLDSVRVGDQDVSGRFFDVEPGTAPFELVFRSDGGTVRGKSEGNARVTLVAVDEVKRDSYLLSWATASADGDFLFQGVRPGEYWAVALETDLPNWVLLRDFNQLYATRAVRVKVGRGEIVTADSVHVVSLP